jgi:hypothetical protein
MPRPVNVLAANTNPYVRGLVGKRKNLRVHYLVKEILHEQGIGIRSRC